MVAAIVCPNEVETHTNDSVFARRRNLFTPEKAIDSPVNANESENTRKTPPKRVRFLDALLKSLAAFSA